VKTAACTQAAVRERAADLKQEMGAEFLRRAVSVMDMTRESAWDGFTPEQCLNILRAVWASGWDIFADYLTFEERVYAARHGKLSKGCMKRLDKELA
jgi:hypothetical protein